MSDYELKQKVDELAFKLDSAQLAYDILREYVIRVLEVAETSKLNMASNKVVSLPLAEFRALSHVGKRLEDMAQALERSDILMRGSKGDA